MHGLKYEHDIGYKGEFEIPDFAKRRFYRIAALLETADIEFIQLKTTLEEYEKSLPEQIDSSPDKTLIDKASLKQYITNSKITKSLDAQMTKHISSFVNENIFAGDQLLTRLKFNKIKTIKELDDVLKSNEKEVMKYFKKFIGEKANMPDGMPQGWSIFFLGYYLSSKDNDFKVMVDFVQNVFPTRKNPEVLATRMQNAIKE